MVKKRTQAYLNLINQLLSCNEGNEPRILQENQELLDRGLIEAMVAVAQYLENVGEENNARWLMNKAQQVEKVLEKLESGAFSLSEDEAEEYIQFLVNALQLVEKNPTTETLYPYLRQNLDKLNETFHKILKRWVDDVLQKGTVPERVVLESAIVIGNFGFLLSNFSFGNTCINKEIVITCYYSALKLVSFSENLDTISELQARFQELLGTGYSERKKGSKKENIGIAISYFENALKFYNFANYAQDWVRIKYNTAHAYLTADNQEMAIILCKEALEVVTQGQFEYKWADIQNILGNAYRQRTKGNKNSNLEIAIKALKAALIVYNREKFPQDWARIQSNLAAAYRNKTEKNYAENIEVAIKNYEEALEVITHASSPQEWATIKNNLGVAYSNRIKGNRAENLENALAAHLKALEVNLPPEKWASVQNNMGNAYRDRISVIKGRENQLNNLKKAVDCFENALTVWNSNGFHQELIKIYNNLGIIHTFYLDLFDSKDEQNRIIEKGIIAFQKALEVCSQKDNSIEWANLQDNLASAYSIRINGDETGNFKQSIFHYKEALKVRTEESFPYEWAKTQHNLANAYFNRAYHQKKNKIENLELAIKAYQNALKIRTKQKYPLKCLQTARGLANLHYSEKQWQPATQAYNTAIEAVENVRLEALKLQNRQEVLSHAIDVFHRIVQAYLNLNQPDKALKYIERSKGRNLVELMTQKNLQPQGVSQEIINKLAELKQAVVNEQIRLQRQVINHNISSNDSLIPYVQDPSHLQQFQQKLDEFIKQKVESIHRPFSLTQKVEPISFTDIQSLTDANTCLIQWYITDEKILAFIVFDDGKINYWQSSEEDRNKLINNISNYLQLYYSETGKPEWINLLPNFLQILADTLHVDDILALIPNACKRLILIPHWFLHILPLHALPISNSSLHKEDKVVSILQDKYDIQYAPSCQLLQIIKQRPLNELTNLFAIQNPTKDLPCTDLEVNILSALFDRHEIIVKDNATKDSVTNHLKTSDSHCYHFYCHGRFNPKNPLESTLLLANKETLNLGKIFELNLKKSRLVVLSACETGLIDLNSISDEYIGLPAGFLFAGSPSVVSSLWTVSDLSTSFLMVKFYEILLEKTRDISVPIALKKAQYWLRNLTAKEFEENLASPTFKQVLNQLQEILSPGDFFELEDAIAITKDRIKKLSSDDKPFVNPFYWAAFTAVGI